MTVQDVIDQLSKVPTEYRQCQLLLASETTDQGMYVTLWHDGEVVIVNNQRTVIDGPTKAITGGGSARVVAPPPIRGRKEGKERGGE